MNNNKNGASGSGGIILYAKQSGCTSFKSLFTIKHAVGTNKVGHTGTLDSFAEGLLVVCTGCLTRLSGIITGFDKEYDAVIKFGEETDTLEPNGQITATADLPEFSAFEAAVNKIKGEQLQTPPSFSAIHVNGKRASDMVRSGEAVQIPPRKITVYEASVKEVQTVDVEDKKCVKYAHITFSVSKGTYIRSLARDIALSCGSRATLIGLRRTKVGSLSLEDAAGASLLPVFGISSVLAGLEKREEASEMVGLTADNAKPSGNAAAFIVASRAKNAEAESRLKEEILNKKLSFSPELAVECGLCVLRLKAGYEKAFFNGQPLKLSFFEEDAGWSESKASEICKYAVLFIDLQILLIFSASCTESIVI